MKSWQIVLTVVAVILIIAIFFFSQNTMIYSSQVVAIEAGENIGMAPFTDRVDFGDIPQGQSVTKTVTLTNGGDNTKSIKIFILGSIANLIDVTPGKSFELGADQDINFRLTMPASATVGKKFSGKIIILELP